MIDHVVLDRELMKDPFHVSMQRGAESGISDHNLQLTKVKVMTRKKSDETEIVAMKEVA